MASISQGNSFLALSPEAGDTPWVRPAVHSFPTSCLVPPRGCVMVYFILTRLSSFHRRGSKGTQSSERGSNLPTVTQRGDGEAGI